MTKKTIAIILSTSLILCQLFVCSTVGNAANVPYASFDFDDYGGETGVLIPDAYEYAKTGDYAVLFRSKAVEGYGTSKIINDSGNKYLEMYGTGSFRNNYVSIQAIKKISDSIQLSFKVKKDSLHDNVNGGGFLRMHLTNSIDGSYKQIGNFITFDTAGNMQLGNGSELETFPYTIKTWYDVTVTLDFSSKKIKYYVSEAGNPSDFITASFEHTFSNVGVIYLGFGVGAMGIDDIEIDEADIFRNVSSSVSDGARGVGINPAFEFEFSSSLDENSIPVADINGDSSYIDEITVIGNKMLITLNTTLDYNTTYTLNIQGIKSLFGDEISKSVIFTTGSESECLASVDSSGKKVKVSFRLPGSSENKKINSYRKNETDLTQIPFNLMIAKSGESTPILTYTDFVNSTMSFEKSFSMPKECESGMYEVSVKTDETVKNSAPFRYINPASASRAFEELNSGKKLSEVVAEHYASLAMTAEEAAAVSEDCEKYFEQYTLGASIGLAEFTNAYANASLKAILTSDESDESKLDAIYNTHLATGVDYESFASRSEAERQYCYNALKEGYNKADTLNEEIKLNLIAYEINASAEYTWEKYEELILGKYSDVIKADTTEYENLKYKSKVINKIKNSTYNELSDIASAFETAVSDQAYEEEYDDSSNNSSGNSGGGGGFGGGGSGAGTGPVLDVNIGNDYIAPMPEQTKNFADVPSSHWAFDAIASLASKGYVSGRDGVNFDPESTITRAEFAKIIASVFSAKPSGGTITFSDVSQNSWYYNEVISLSELGIILGDTNGNFNPNHNITRQDMAVIIERACTAFGITTNTNAQSVSFTDSTLISGYARDAVESLSASGVINGMPDGSFNPMGTLTRAQACKVIYEITK